MRYSFSFLFGRKWAMPRPIKQKYHILKHIGCKGHVIQVFSIRTLKVGWFFVRSDSISRTLSISRVPCILLNLIWGIKAFDALCSPFDLHKQAYLRSDLDRGSQLHPIWEYGSDKILSFVQSGLMWRTIKTITDYLVPFVLNLFSD
jgi:hypothetical protein